jgi:hypothetical protein
VTCNYDPEDLCNVLKEITQFLMRNKAALKMLTRNLVTSQKETINVRVMGFGE